MNRQYLVTAAVLGVLCVGYYFWQFSSGPSPSRLATQALSAGDTKERMIAMADLTMMQLPGVVPALQRVAANSKDTEVLAFSLAGLLDRVNDRATLPLFVANLEHESVKVREVAFKGVMRLACIDQDKTDFEPDAPPEVRGPAGGNGSGTTGLFNIAYVDGHCDTVMTSAVSPGVPGNGDFYWNNGGAGRQD